MRLSNNAGGYLAVDLALGHCDTKRRLVHNLVLEAFVGPRPEGYDGCHNNGDPADNRLENLRWDTKSANILDAVRHGTHYEARQTHCKRGHEYDQMSSSGRRVCSQCRHITYKRRRAAKSC